MSLFNFRLVLLLSGLVCAAALFAAPRKQLTPVEKQFAQALKGGDAAYFRSLSWDALQAANTSGHGYRGDQTLMEARCAWNVSCIPALLGALDNADARVVNVALESIKGAQTAVGFSLGYELQIGSDGTRKLNRRGTPNLNAIRALRKWAAAATKGQGRRSAIGSELSSLFALTAPEAVFFRRWTDLAEMDPKHYQVTVSMGSGIYLNYYDLEAVRAVAKAQSHDRANPQTQKLLLQWLLGLPDSIWSERAPAYREHKQLAGFFDEQAVSAKAPGAGEKLKELAAKMRQVPGRLACKKTANATRSQASRACRSLKGAERGKCWSRAWQTYQTSVNQCIAAIK